MSLPEVMLWEQLRAGKQGFKVRRQHPIGSYIADFYVGNARLVIEVDGQAHDFGDRPSRDIARDNYMRAQGYRTLRLIARDVLRDLDAALALIAEHAGTPLHHAAHGPPPHAGEDL